MPALSLPRLFTIALVVAFSLETPAEVVINEIGAAGNDRLLRSHADGRPRLGWGPSWCELAFDDADWDTGTAPFGFGVEGIATDLGAAMRGRTPSVYLRKTFTVSADEAASSVPITLTAQADSGFVAFINGHEIARANLGRLNGFVYRVQSAFSSAESDKTLTYESVSLASELLQPGENVFAVQVQNTVPSQINERDQTIDTSLKFEGTLALAATPIALSNEEWKYRVGHAEPSGGVVDWAQAAHPDGDGDFSDWIELHNNGATEVDLTGWHLTDYAAEPMQWPFPDKTTIPADGYLLVLADGNTEVPGDHLHANFGLSAGGEYLGLSNVSGDVVSQFEDDFPKQHPFHSYGRSVNGEDSHTFFETPTPGAANTGRELSTVVKKPKFSPAGGVYDDSVTLTLTSNTEDALIRYTLDGSEPTETHGMDYSESIIIGPIDDRTGTPVRARAFKDGMVASNDGTQTYLVGVDDAFKTIPTLSLVADAGEAFYKPHGVLSIVGRNVPTTVSEYYMPAMHGRAFERKISTEFIYPDDGTNVQMDGGLRLSASAFSRGSFFLGNTDASPWVSRSAEKSSFNLFYRNDYGGDTLNFPVVENYPVREFRQFRLRAGKNDIINPFITDEMARRVFADTGQFSAVGMQCALFVNGSYKGYYNPVARLREGLLQDLHGSDAPWQVKHIDVWADGSPFEDKLIDTPEWDHLESLLSKDLRTLANYEAVLEELDPVNFADYFIVNFYGATGDWPHNNLIIARELSENGRWRAYMWDAEVIFGVQTSHSLTHDTIKSEFENPRSSPSDDLATVWSSLSKSPEWRLLFADRLQRHFFTPGGALTKANLTWRMEELAGDVGPLLAFSGETIDTSEIEGWIAGREEFLFDGGNYWEAKGLWSSTRAPILTPSGGSIVPGSGVEISVATVERRSTIYYTTDGSDPRLPGGDLNPDAVAVDPETGASIVLEANATIKARVQIKTVFSSSWGTLQEASFRVGLESATPGNLLISELMVDPESPNEAEKAAGYAASSFEYVEFYNPTEVAVDLADLRFTAGINYDFAEGNLTTLGPKGFGVIVNDAAAFTTRYGETALILGEYNRKLSNGGEHLEISNGQFETIVSLTYSDDEPWPSNAGDEGNSLVFTLVPDADPNSPTNWTASTLKGGTPGRASDEAGPPDPSPGDAYNNWKAKHFTEAEQKDGTISGFLSDPDHDGSVNLVEFVFGAIPKDATSVLVFGATVAEGQLTLTLTQRTGDAVRYTLERSADLETWSTVGVGDLTEVSSEAAGEGLRKVTYQSSAPMGPDSAYLRWRVDTVGP